MKPYIIIAEDEEDIAMMLEYNLEKAGFETHIEADGEQALYAIEERIPDLLLLDWMIPSMNGIELCKHLRGESKTRQVPVIMLTARGQEEDRLAGLESGADDYVVKPFSPQEVVARIHAVLRRTRPVLEEKKLIWGKIALDLQSYQVTYDGEVLHLGPTEFRLLAYLMEHPGKVLSRTQLLDTVWGSDAFLETRTVDVHIRRLRKVLEPYHMDEAIRTVRGAGYVLEPI